MEVYKHNSHESYCLEEWGGVLSEGTVSSTTNDLEYQHSKTINICFFCKLSSNKIFRSYITSIPPNIAGLGVLDKVEIQSKERYLVEVSYSVPAIPVLR